MHLQTECDTAGANVGHDSGPETVSDSIVAERNVEWTWNRSDPGKGQKPTEQTRSRERFWKEAFEYLWLGDEVKRLSRAIHSEDELARAKYATRAKLVAQAAEDHLLRWRLPGAIPNWVAVGLYREAVHWSLLSLQGRSLSVVELFELTRPELLKDLGEKASLITPELLEGNYLQAAELAPAVLEEQVARLRQLYQAVRARAEAPVRRYRQALRDRVVHVVLFLIAVVSIFTALTLGIRAALTPPDLAYGKPWHASSAYPGFIYDTHVCDNLPTQILFHTKEEESPWFEIDLGKVQSFREIEIMNREAFQARAVPLVVEVSSDHETYREVAVQEQPFDTWSIKLPKTEARYVRARATRKTWLHLRKMTIR